MYTPNHIDPQYLADRALYDIERRVGPLPPHHKRWFSDFIVDLIRSYHDDCVAECNFS